MDSSYRPWRHVRVVAHGPLPERENLRRDANEVIVVRVGGGTLGCLPLVRLSMCGWQMEQARSSGSMEAVMAGGRRTMAERPASPVHVLARGRQHARRCSSPAPLGGASTAATATSRKDVMVAAPASCPLHLRPHCNSHGGDGSWSCWTYPTSPMSLASRSFHRRSVTRASFFPYVTLAV
jgi:hypothetical protein